MSFQTSGIEYSLFHTLTNSLPYSLEEIEFKNENADITLSGTLTLPRGKSSYPAVILISGSGPQTRDGEFAGHKQFVVLAGHLAKNGIAVLRFDDRGFGKSTGNFATATSFDFSYHVESAVRYLMRRREIRKGKIGLIGHSDGAMIAPMVAARLKNVGFIDFMAGPGVPGPEVLLHSQEIIERKAGLDEDEIKKSRLQSEKIIAIVSNAVDAEAAKRELQTFAKNNYNDIPDKAIPPGMTKDEFIQRSIEMFATPWFNYFLTYDPRPVLQKVSCAALALNYY